jgi:hypothetical protein
MFCKQVVRGSSPISSTASSITSAMIPADGDAIRVILNVRPRYLVSGGTPPKAALAVAWRT